MTAAYLTYASRLLAPQAAFNVRDHIPVLRWGREIGRLAQTASPIILIGMLNMAMSILDIVMLGAHDARGLAAAVVVSDLYSILFNFSAGFAGMVAPQVAVALGAGVRWHVCSIVRRAMALVLALGIVGAVVLLLSPAVLEAAGARQLGLAAGYARFMAGTYVFMLLFALVRTVLSALGRPGPALFAIVLALPVKAAANHAFIWGAWGAPELGVAGAGLASLLAAVLMGGSLTLYLFLSPSVAECGHPGPIPHVLPGLWSLVRTGALMGLAALSETGMFLASTMMVGLFAPQQLIVHALSFRAMAFFYLLLAGTGQAITIRMAFLRGRAARSCDVHALRAATSCSLALAGLVLALLVAGAGGTAHVLAAATRSDPALVEGTAGLLRISGLTLVAMIPGHIGMAVLRAREDVFVPTALIFVSYWGVALAVMLTLATAGYGARGIWLGLLLGAATCSACFAVYLGAQAGSRASRSSA